METVQITDSQRVDLADGTDLGGGHFNQSLSIPAGATSVEFYVEVRRPYQAQVIIGCEGVDEVERHAFADWWRAIDFDDTPRTNADGSDNTELSAVPEFQTYRFSKDAPAGGVLPAFSMLVGGFRQTGDGSMVSPLASGDHPDLVFQAETTATLHCSAVRFPPPA